MEVPKVIYLQQQMVGGILCWVESTSHDEGDVCFVREDTAIWPHWIKTSNHLPLTCRPVIIFVKVPGAKHKEDSTKRLRAMYAREGDLDDEFTGEWCKEGWYEFNENEETSFRVHGEVTHWTELPEPPK